MVLKNVAHFSFLSAFEATQKVVQKRIILIISNASSLLRISKTFGANKSNKSY